MLFSFFMHLYSKNECSFLQVLIGKSDLIAKMRSRSRARIVQDFDLKWFGRVEVKATCMSQHLCKYDDAAGKPAVSHMWGSNAAGISDTPRDALAYGGTCF